MWALRGAAWDFEPLPTAPKGYTAQICIYVSLALAVLLIVVIIDIASVDELLNVVILDIAGVDELALFVAPRLQLMQQSHSLSMTCFLVLGLVAQLPLRLDDQVEDRDIHGAGTAVGEGQSRL